VRGACLGVESGPNVTVLRSGSATDTGLVRRTNQDQLLVAKPLFAVADGMGGHVGGEVASQLAVDALRDAFIGHGGPHDRDPDDRGPDGWGRDDRGPDEWGRSDRGPDGRGSPPSSEVLLAAIRRANTAVYERSQASPELRGMGTTITAAALVVDQGEDRLAIANVGDSRAYIFDHGELTQLTEDHSVAEELVRQGQLDPAEVDTHPQRHILTRAMGILPDVDIDLWEVLPYAGIRILLCSDGLVREITDGQIASVLRRLADPGEAAQELVARARANGGSDNITVVVVDVVDDGGLASSASSAVATAGDATSSPGAPMGPGGDAPSVPDGRLAGAEGHAAGGAVGAAHAVVGGRGADAIDPRPERQSGGGPTARPAPARDAKTLATTPVTFPAPPGASGTAAPAPALRRRRRVTLRVVLFVVVLGGVLGGAGVAIVTYARASYFVTLGPPGPATTSVAAAASSTATSRPPSSTTARPLVIDHGRPGGLLWFKPTLAEMTAVSSSDVLAARIPDLQKGKLFSSLPTARAYVANLRAEAGAAGVRDAQVPRAATTGSPTSVAPTTALPAIAPVVTTPVTTTSTAAKPAPAAPANGPSTTRR